VGVVVAGVGEEAAAGVHEPPAVAEVAVQAAAVAPAEICRPVARAAAVGVEEGEVAVVAVGPEMRVVAEAGAKPSFTISRAVPD
jgi:hypothetical protein